MESAAADETSQAENASVSQYSESAFASGASGTEGTQEETHAVPRRRRRLHRYVEKDNRVVLPPDVDALVFTMAWEVEDSDENTDLDAGVMVFDEEGNQIDSVHFARLITANGAIHHLGDAVSSGAGVSEDEDCEQVVVHLSRLPESFETLAFIINNYTGTFRDVRWAEAQVCECRISPIEKVPIWSTAREVATFEMLGGGEYRACLVCKLHRMHAPRRRRRLTAHGRDAEGGFTEADLRRLPPVWRSPMILHDRTSPQPLTAAQLAAYMNADSTARLAASARLLTSGQDSGDGRGDGRGRSSDGVSLWTLHLIGERAQGHSLPDLMPLIRSRMVDVVPHIDPDPSRSKVQSASEIVTLLDMNAIGRLEHAFRVAERDTGEDGLTLENFVRVISKHLGWRVDLTVEEIREGVADEEAKRLALVKELYNQIDVDGDGTVTWEEFTSYCVGAGMEMADEEREDAGEDYEFVEAERFNAKSVPATPVCMRWSRDLDAMVLCEKNSATVKFVTAGGRVRYTLTLPQDPAAVGNSGARRKSVALAAEYMSELEMLAVSTSDLTVQLWRVEDAEPWIVGTIQGRKSQTLLRWSVSSLLLYSSASDVDVQVWDPRARTHVSTLCAHTDRVTAFEELPDHNLMASASMDRSIVLWDVHRLQHRATLRGHSMAVTCLAYCPRTKLLLSSGFEFDILGWDVDARRVMLRLRGHRMPLVGVKVLHDDRVPRAISADGGANFRLWNLTTGTATSDGAASSQALHVFAPGPGTALRPLLGMVVPQRPRYSREKPYGAILVAGASRLAIFRRRLVGQIDLSPTCAAYNQSSMSFVVGVGASLHVYSARTGHLARVFQDVAGDEIATVCFDHRERRIVVGTQSGRVGIYNSVNGQPMKSLPRHQHHLVLLRFLDRYSILVTLSQDGVLHVLDDRAESEENPLMRGVRGTHIDALTSAADMSERLSFIVTGGSDGTVNVWDFASVSLICHARVHRCDITAVHIVDPFHVCVTADSAGGIAISELPAPRPSNAAPVTPEGEPRDLVVLARFRYRPPPLRHDPLFPVPITCIRSRPSARVVAATAHSASALSQLTPSLDGTGGPTDEALNDVTELTRAVTLEEEGEEGEHGDQGGGERPGSEEDAADSAAPAVGSPGRRRRDSLDSNFSEASVSDVSMDEGAAEKLSSAREELVALLETDEDASHTLLLLADDSGWVSKWSLRELFASLPAHCRPRPVPDAKCHSYSKHYNPWRRYTADEDFHPHRLSWLHRERKQKERASRRQRRRETRRQLKRQRQRQQGGAATAARESGAGAQGHRGSEGGSQDATFLTAVGTAGTEEAAGGASSSTPVRNGGPQQQEQEEEEQDVAVDTTGVTWGLSREDAGPGTGGGVDMVPPVHTLPQLRQDLWMLAYWRLHMDAVLQMSSISEPASLLTVSYDKSVRVTSMTGKALGTVLSRTKHPDAIKRKGQEAEWLWRFKCRTRLQDAETVVEELREAHAVEEDAKARQERAQRLREEEEELSRQGLPQRPVSQDEDAYLHELRRVTQSRMKRGRRRAGALGQLVTAVERRRQLCAQQEVSESGSQSSSEGEGEEGAEAGGAPKPQRAKHAVVGDTQKLLAKTSMSLQGSAEERGKAHPAVGDPINVGVDATEGEEAVRRELAEERAKITQRRSLPEAFSERRMQDGVSSGTFDALERAWLKEAVNRGLAQALHRDVMHRFDGVDPVSLEEVAAGPQAQAELMRMRRSRQHGHHGDLSRYGNMRREVDRKPGPASHGIDGNRPLDELLSDFHQREIGPVLSPRSRNAKIEARRKAFKRRGMYLKRKLSQAGAGGGKKGGSHAPRRLPRMHPSASAPVVPKHSMSGLEVVEEEEEGASEKAGTMRAGAGHASQPHLPTPEKRQLPSLARSGTRGSRSPAPLSSGSDSDVGFARINMATAAAEAAAAAAQAEATAAAAASRAAARRRESSDPVTQAQAHGRASGGASPPESRGGGGREESRRPAAKTKRWAHLSEEERAEQQARMQARMRSMDHILRREDAAHAALRADKTGGKSRASLISRQSTYGSGGSTIVDQTKVTASDRIGDYTKKDAAAVVAAYRALDHDGNGQLDINKFVMKVQQDAPRLSVQKHIQSLFHEADQSPDGSLRLDDVLRYVFPRATKKQRMQMAALSKKQATRQRAKAGAMRELTAEEVEEFRQIFHLYDANSDGVLSVEEIINAFSEITAESKGKGGMDVQDIINMFDAVDVNRDRVLEFHEFLELVAESDG